VEKLRLGLGRPYGGRSIQQANNRSAPRLTPQAAERSTAVSRWRTTYSMSESGIFVWNRRASVLRATRSVPKDPRYYYDQIHFNEAGSEAPAEIVATELVSIMSAGTNARP
jgi:hypothetical protein